MHYQRFAPTACKVMDAWHSFLPSLPCEPGWWTWWFTPPVRPLGLFSAPPDLRAPGFLQRASAKPPNSVCCKHRRSSRWVRTVLCQDIPISQITIHFHKCSLRVYKWLCICGGSWSCLTIFMSLSPQRARALAASGPVFTAFTPQSILRSSLRPTPVATPSASPGRSITPPIRSKESRITFIEEESPEPEKCIRWTNGVRPNTGLEAAHKANKNSLVCAYCQCISFFLSC